MKVTEEVKLRFDEIKKKKTHRYVVFFIKDEKAIAVEKMGTYLMIHAGNMRCNALSLFAIQFISGGREASYDSFLTELMACGPEDCRYGLFDFEYNHQCEGTTEKTKKEKLLLMSWCPDTAKIKKKMLYSSSFDALKRCLVGVQKYIQVRK